MSSGLKTGVRQLLRVLHYRLEKTRAILMIFSPTKLEINKSYEAILSKNELEDEKVWGNNNANVGIKNGKTE